MIKRSTQVPNILFDRYLPYLKESELKILLVVIRQTYGWVDKRTGRRKTRDRITRRQFMQKTGLSRRVVSKAIQSLVEKRLIQVTDYTGKHLLRAQDRRGRVWIYFSVVNVETRSNRMVSIQELLVHHN